MFGRLRSAWQLAVHPSRFESELDDEMREHLRARAEDLMRDGVPAEEAERRARREFGRVTALKEECREATAFAGLFSFLRDVRYGFRLLRRSPGFAAVAVITLALCIGANTAMFSIVDAVLFRPLDYPHPEQLASLVVETPGEAEPLSRSFNGTQWETFRDAAAATGVDTAVYSDWIGGVNVVAPGGVEFVEQQRIGSGFFGVLRVKPWLGRDFTRDEDRDGGPNVVILSHDLWQRLFRGDPSLIGSKVTLRGDVHTIVGVMPRGFRSTSQAGVWTPLRASRVGEGSGENFAILARLRKGVSWAAADARVRALREALFPGATRPHEVRLESVQQVRAAGYRKPLLVLWSAVALVLLIGCVNLAGLLVARSSLRVREIATRISLGGGRGPVLRQLIAEGVALGCCGAAGGVLVGAVALRAVRSLVASLALPYELRVDWRVLTMTIAVSVLASILFSVYPAVQLTRVPIASIIGSSGSRVAHGRTRHWTRRLLVVTQVALSVVLLLGAALLIRSFTFLQKNGRNFRPEGVVIGTVSLQDSRYDSFARASRLFEATLERIRGEAGVEAAAVALTVPYERPLNIGFRTSPEDKWQTVNLVYCTPELFKAIGAPLLRGRDFDSRDTQQSRRVVIANEAFMTRVMRGRVEVGSAVEVAKEEREIVGVAPNVAQRPGFGEFMPVDVTPTVYVPVTQMPDGLLVVHTWFAPSWIVRGSQEAASVAAIRRALSAVDPNLPLAKVRTFDDVANDALAVQRFQALLMAAMATLALVLCAVGVAGLIGTSVTERTREIGIRLAFGAPRSAVVAASAAPGIALTALGLVAGAAAVPLATRVLQGFLWGIEPMDPGSIAGVVSLMLMTALFASLAPALRIVHIDPAVILRQE